MPQRTQFVGYPAATLQNMVGYPRELMVDTTNFRLVMHDGVTPGGAGITALLSDLANYATLTGLATALDALETDLEGQIGTLASETTTALNLLMPKAGGTFTGGVLFEKNTIRTALDKGTVTAGTVSFDVQDAGVQRLQVGGALTIELTNRPATGFWELEIELTNGGSAVITWPTVNWCLGDGTTSTTFSNMGISLAAAGVNTVLIWGRGNVATPHGRAI